MGRKNYFSGWYYKQEKGGEAIAFIPAFHLSEAGRCASIQVITKDETLNFDFPIEAVRVNVKKNKIRIGNNIFTPDGILADLRGEKNGKIIRVKGRLRYQHQTPLKYDIMGPFSLIPCLQCRHGVVSMAHTVTGSMVCGGRMINLDGAAGYIEKDSGGSFPSWYFWCQCGLRTKGRGALMVSVADIPFCGAHFKGCIAAVIYRGKEYRLATYLGARIARISRGEVVLCQGKLCLRVTVSGGGLSLRAPQKGSMRRIIKENLVCRIHALLYEEGKLIFDYSGNGSAESELPEGIYSCN